MQRPLVVFSLLFANGLALGLTFPPWLHDAGDPAKGALLISCVLTLAMIVYGSDRHLTAAPSFAPRVKAPALRWLLYSLIVITAAFYAAQAAQITSSITTDQDERITVRGTITEAQYSPERRTYRLRLENGEIIGLRQFGPFGSRSEAGATTEAALTGAGATTKAIALTEADATTEAGSVYVNQIVRATGKIQRPSPPRNPGDFDYQAYLWRQGIAVELLLDRQGGLELLSPEEEAFVRSRTGILTSIIDQIQATAARQRLNLEAFVDAATAPEEGAIIKGILFGGQAGLSPADRDAFRLTGVAHAFAVSGANIAVITASVLWILQGHPRFRLPLRPSLALTAVIITFYSWMAGFPPSVQRALAMALMALLARGLSRRTDPPTLIAAAALPLLLWEPLMIADPGFQLSFIATWGIIYLLPALTPRPSRTSQESISSQPSIGSGPSITLSMLAAYQEGAVTVPTEAVGEAKGKSAGPEQDVARDATHNEAGAAAEDGASGSPWTQKLRQGLITAACLTVAAQIAVAPLSIYHFNLFSLAGFVANLAAGTIIGLVTNIGMAASVLQFISTDLAALLLQPVALLVSIMRTALQFLAELPGAALTIASPHPLWIVLFYGLLLLWREFRLDHLSPKHSAWILQFAPPGALLLMALIAFTWWWPQPLRVVFLDVGQGDSIVIHPPTGDPILIDAPGPARSWGNQSNSGPATPRDPGATTVLPYLNRTGTTRLSAVINTHADQDHIGGLLAIIKAIPVERLILSPSPEPNEAYLSLLELAQQRGITVVEAPAPESDLAPLAAQKHDPPLHLHVLYPTVDSRPENINDSSIVTALTYGSLRLLLTGDVDKNGQEQLLKHFSDSNQEQPLLAHIVKVPHHGSSRTFHSNLPPATQPRLAIISVGKNTFGHPAKTVIDAWANTGATVLRTDHHGAVTIESDGTIMNWRTMLRNPMIMSPQ
ncbi:ComEC/Rec2 family competence protein [Heliophilum fasciatum]|uniref:ComEC/Rec2-related protein n=1 Tax=Heliophilum fasciatum TaxID=35700 RepID=A0A4R2RND1_9FIRM|nr:ComEC/Rec2 family competence protein [Heliophilum fasciatum]MCW2278119.1 competence protein ComEC [Heliophilum fasciatum]TCP64189.1 ComEC/Rec2-related protein [Heliophilum fasciatum]